MNRTTLAALVAASFSASLAAIPASAEDAPRAPAPKAEAPAESKADLERAATEAFSRVDRNGDAYLRGAEIPAEWADRYDRDGDGAIARSEFVDVMSRPPKLRRLHPLRDVRARVAQTLRSFDKSKDGSVQREEYPGREETFRSFDRNKDATLQPSEIAALCEEEIEDIRRKMKSPGRGDFLAVFDTDGDNKVDASEYDGTAAAFRKFDTDGDGTVTYAEIYPERMMAAKESGPKPESANVLQSLDKDGDGKVARSEFTGSDAAWKRLDTNGDGVLTSADGR